MNIIYATIQNIISDKYYGVSENIEIIKGKNKLSFFSFETIKRRFFMFLNKNKITWQIQRKKLK